MNLHFILVISIRGVETDVPESLAWISIINAMSNWLVFLLPMIPVEINYESRMTRFILGTVPPVGVFLSTYLLVFAVGVYIGAA
ncbi:hypothetical protein EDC04DRAFT_2681552 [Pisolithus marmoratus]|nr:hypothetical protein EDC04DRAFT_2681552 [Pisolithus marmoratus]